MGVRESRRLGKAADEALAVERDDEHIGIVLDQREGVGRLLGPVVQLDRAGREVEAVAHAGGEREDGHGGVSGRFHKIAQTCDIRSCLT